MYTELLLAQRQTKAAAEAAQARHLLSPKDPRETFIIASQFARCAALSAPAAKEVDYYQRTLDLLQLALNSGFSDPALYQQQTPVFQPLKGRSQFDSLWDKLAVQCKSK